jgi:glucosamine-6-phosphate deaminase
MELVIQSNAEAAADCVAQEIAMALRAKPTLVLGLATGGTMEKVYARLVVLYRELNLDFSGCRTFNLDEYIGLPAEHPNSYHYYMERHLFRHININPRNTHLPNGVATDLKAECVRYEELIVQSGGIDLQLLGIGQNGHLGFNEPGASFNSHTHVEVLAEATRVQNAQYFVSSDEMPERAVTMGMGSILAARRCILLATGDEKAQIIAKTLKGPQTNQVPASALQTHPNCLVVLDEAAASRIEKKRALGVR